MKNGLLCLLIVMTWSLNAQTPKTTARMKERIQAIEDHTALKALVDHFSILADQKNAQAQTLLFTEDATIETYQHGQLVANLKGRQQIGDIFGAFLKNFETVYHFNGQQVLKLNGDKANGTSYCLVTLIGIENGKRTKTNFGVTYHDEFVRINNQWLIAKRKSTFEWEDKQSFE